jgi:hypothetical protein
MLFVSAVGAQAQMGYWSLPPHKVNVSGPSPSAVNLFSHPSTTYNYRISNAAYDEAGNTIFYVIDSTIFNASGNTIGTLSSYYLLETLQGELAIIPVPGSCTDYYIIYAKINNVLLDASISIELEKLAILYTRVRNTNGVISIINNGVVINSNIKGRSLSFAIGRSNGSNRDLYVLGYPKILRYSIGSSGIILTSTLHDASLGSSPLTPLDFNSTELEVSDNGPITSMLTWGTWQGNKIWKLSVNGGTPSATTLPYSNVYGVEFKPGSNSIVYASVNGGSSTINGGIYKVNVNAGTTSAIITGGLYNTTQLEAAKDGFIYGIKGSNKLLGRLNPATDIFTQDVLSNPIASNEPTGIFTSGFRLPDQVDGEVYQSYGRVLYYQQLSIVNGSSSVTPLNNINRVLNCAPIRLFIAANDYNAYRLEVYSSDVNGNKVTGPGKMDYNSGVVPTNFPYFTLDLRTLQSNYLQSNTGNFLVTLTLISCNTQLSRSAILDVSNISAISSNFRLNYGDGNLVIPGSSYSNAVSTGQLFVGINASTSTGLLDYYSTKIQKVDPSGNVIENVCNPSSLVAIPNSSPASLGSISLNGLVKNRCSGPTNYFTLAANVNQVYKLEFTVQNACGSATSVGFFKNMDPNWRMGNFELLDDGVNFTQVFPNPANGTFNIRYALKEAREVSIKIFNSTGGEAKVILNKQAMTTGEHVQSVDISGFPKGIYLYQIEAESISSGQIVLE